MGSRNHEKKENDNNQDCTYPASERVIRSRPDLLYYILYICLCNDSIMGSRNHEKKKIIIIKIIHIQHLSALYGHVLTYYIIYIIYMYM